MEKQRPPAVVVRLPCRSCGRIWGSVPCPVCVRGLALDEADELERLGKLDLRAVAAIAACFQRGRLRNDSILDCAHGRPLKRSCGDCATFAADYEQAILTASGGSTPPHTFTLDAAPGDKLAHAAIAELATLGMSVGLVIPHLLVANLDAIEGQRPLLGVEERLRQALSDALHHYFFARSSKPPRPALHEGRGSFPQPTSGVRGQGPGSTP